MPDVWQKPVKQIESIINSKTNPVIFLKKENNIMH